MSNKACPGCGDDTNLYSSEQIEILYPIRVPAEYHALPNDTYQGFDYTGEQTFSYDESAEFRNRVCCKSCMWEGPLSRLIVPAAEALRCEEAS